MPEDTGIDIVEPRHVATVSRWIGAVMVREAMEQAKEFDKLPGFALARALVDKEVEDMRGQALMMNLRAVAKAGHDIARTRNVGLETKGNHLRLVIEEMDLADIAEDG